MSYLAVSLSIVHLFTSLLWVSAIIFIVLVFHPLWKKYKEYTYFWNFRTELIVSVLRILNITLALSIITGAGLAGLYHRVVLSGNYGLFFSIKMALLVGMFFLAQPYMRLSDQKDFSELSKLPVMHENLHPFHWRSVLIVCAGLALTAMGLLLRRF